MKVSVEITPGVIEPYAVIYAAQVTEAGNGRDPAGDGSAWNQRCTGYRLS